MTFDATKLPKAFYTVTFRGDHKAFIEAERWCDQQQALPRIVIENGGHAFRFDNDNDAKAFQSQFAGLTGSIRLGFHVRP